VHLYLNIQGGTQGTFDYAMMKVHQNISQCKLIDIGFALGNVYQIEEENAAKFFKRVEIYVVLTHEKLMKGKNINGLITVMMAFDAAK
jgi:hypothetical protein